MKAEECEDVVGPTCDWEVHVVHQVQDVDGKPKLLEDLHYGKVLKEALPIHLDNNILKRISILRGVKKDHNMVRYLSFVT